MDSHAPNLGVILLVDDDPTNLRILTLCLESYGFDLAVATDGETALQQSQLQRPDLILLDVTMPGIDGYETCRRFKEDEHTKDIPVIFMTALSDNQHIIKAFSVGAVDYVTKPIYQEELIARVVTHLRIRGLQQRLEETVASLQQEVAEHRRTEGRLREAMDMATTANDHMRKDLEAAARVQHALLPESPPAVPGVSFAWVYRPCAELGGDSLNVFQLDDRHIGLYVLDVSGHGVQASLLSVTLSRVLIPRRDPSCLFTRSDMLGGTGTLTSPAEVASRLNHMFPMGENTQQYFTLVYGVIDTQERTFRYVCAGHPPPIHSGQGEHPTFCDAPSLPIGFFEDEQYEESTVQLRSGSRMYLYSDGVLEARNHEREIFGEQKLLSTIEDFQQSGLQESVDSIVQDVLKWTGTDQVHDDLSILAVEFK